MLVVHLLVLVIVVIFRLLLFFVVAVFLAARLEHHVLPQSCCVILELQGKKLSDVQSWVQVDVEILVVEDAFDGEVWGLV